MGTPGVPWTATDDQIAKALKAADGLVTYAAKALNVDYTTLRRRLDKSPHLMELLSNLRNAFDENLMDLAESRLKQLVAQDEDKGVAMRGLQFSLNNKGAPRGYRRQVEGQDDTKAVGVLEKLNNISVADDGQSNAAPSLKPQTD